MTEPFIKRKAGDFITAQDWNEIQTRIRDFLNRHTHTGEADQGMILNGNAMAQSTVLTVKGLSVDEISAADGKTMTITGNTSIGFESAEAKLAINGGVNIGGVADPGDKNLIVAGIATIGKSLSVKDSLTVGRLEANGRMIALGNVGIGVKDPKAKLSVGGGANIGGAANPRDKNRSVAGSTTIGKDLTVKGTTTTTNLAINDQLTCKGKVNFGTKTKTTRLTVYGGIFAENSDLYFTHANHDHTGIGNTKGHAAVRKCQELRCTDDIGPSRNGKRSLC